MGYGMSVENLPSWMDSSFRYFEKHERHITRECNYMSALVMVFEGVLRFTEDGVPIEVSAGEYYIQRPGYMQDGARESDCPKYFFIHFKDAEYSDRENTIPIHGEADFLELFPLFKEMETLRVTGAPLVEKSIVFYKILSVLRKNANRKGKSEVIAKVISEVTEDIRRPFSLEEIAARCGYSRSQMINIFKRETGMTPYAFINDMKIKMAKQLLLYSNSSLTSISVECGFGSYTNLYRCFVREVGCSPAEWKKTQKILQKV